MIKLRFYELDDKKYDYCAFTGGDELKLSPPIPSCAIVRTDGSFANFLMRDEFIASALVKMACEALAMMPEIKKKLELENDGFRFAAISELISVSAGIKEAEIVREDSSEMQKLNEFMKKNRRHCLRIIATKRLIDGQYSFPFNRTSGFINMILAEAHNIIRGADEISDISGIIILASLAALYCAEV